MERLRFTLVAVCGVIFDVGLALVLSEWIGTPLWLAATLGFLMAATGNYVAHELWTFRSGPRKISTWRAASYVGASLITLAVRLAVIALFGRLFGLAYPLIVLISAAGVSFGVNFILSKFFIFTRRSGTQ
jgi:putative flippase GtrA